MDLSYIEAGAVSRVIRMAEESKSIHPNALPNYERAAIPRNKLENYALNPLHEPDGKHKAHVFKSVLWF